MGQIWYAHRDAAVIAGSYEIIRSAASIADPCSRDDRAGGSGCSVLTSLHPKTGQCAIIALTMPWALEKQRGGELVMPSGSPAKFSPNSFGTSHWQ